MSLPTIAYERLRVEFKRKEDTAVALSQYLGLCYTAVLYKLSGKREFTIPEAKKLAVRYGTPMDELFELSDGERDSA